MGSPLAPLLAEWFVSGIEQKIFEADTTFKPLFYRRYVDDIFAIFEKPEDRDQFFEMLNKMHKNLTFTMETTTSSLPFLDISVTINGGRFDTQVYRKPTNTGVQMNFNSMAPRKWKRSLVNYMLLRAYRLSSNYNFFQSETVKIREILIKNSYPSHLIDEMIRKFTDRFKIESQNFKCRSEDNIEHDNTAKLKRVYLKIPFFGKPSQTFQRRIQEQLRNFDIDIRPAFSTTKVSSYFCLKSQCSIFFKADVVYKFTCTRDESISYIGETRRQLFIRISEHCSGKDKQSAVFSHLYECEDCQNMESYKCFQVLQHCDKFNVYTMESILISTHRPKLNVQLVPGKGRMVSLSLYN